MTYPLKPIPFSWSWTALKNYRSCPKKHFETAILKNFKDVRSEALSWGDAFHDAMAKRLTTKRLLPPDYQKYEKLAKWVEGRADRRPATRRDCNLAINRHHPADRLFRSRRVAPRQARRADRQWRRTPS